MNKKGVISLEALVKLIPHLLITIGLLTVLVVMLAIFFTREKTPEEQDFQRIIAEVDELVKTPYKGSEFVSVPIKKESKLSIIIYPAGKSPAKCEDKSCICQTIQKDGGYVENCKVYNKISNVCKEECGGICFSSVKRIIIAPEATTVTIARGCNEITIS